MVDKLSNVTNVNRHDMKIFIEHFVNLCLLTNLFIRARSMLESFQESQTLCFRFGLVFFQEGRIKQ